MLPRRFVYAAPSQPTHESGTRRMKAADAYLVITNLPDRGSAAKLAFELVEKRLAACINILSPCRSIYRWKGKTEDAEEFPMLIKTTSARYAELASVTLGPPQFPKGQVHEDKFFGKQETYRKEVRIRLPVEAAGAERLKLLVTSQGCADLGVCYVPQVQSADLRLTSLGGPRSSILRESEPFASSPERVTAASDDV